MTRALLALVGLSLVACTADRATIYLSVDTTLAVPCEVDHLRVRATGSEASIVEIDLATTVLPHTITLEDGTENGTFQLEIVGEKAGEPVLAAAGQMQFGHGAPLAANVVLEAACTPEAPCAMPALAPYVAPPAPATRSDCGLLTTRYAPGPAVESYREVCSVPPTAKAGKVLMGARGAAQLPLSPEVLAGFNFRFYGRPIRQVWAHEDGYISFGADNPDPNGDLNPGPFDRDLRGVGVPPPKQSIFAFWDALTPGPLGVCYALEGLPGNQKLRVSWVGTCNVSACSPSNNLNVTLVLDEKNNRISLTYGDMLSSNPQLAQGAQATVGLVNTSPACVATACDAATGLCQDGKTPCGYTQVFSNVPQTPMVTNVQFDPLPP